MRRYIHNHHPGIVDIHNCGACLDNDATVDHHHPRIKYVVVTTADGRPYIVKHVLDQPDDDRACRDGGYILPVDTGRHIANYDHLARVHRPDATLQHLDTR